MPFARLAATVAALVIGAALLFGTVPTDAPQVRATPGAAGSAPTGVITLGPGSGDAVVPPQAALRTDRPVHPTPSQHTLLGVQVAAAAVAAYLLGTSAGDGVTCEQVSIQRPECRGPPRH